MTKKAALVIILSIVLIGILASAVWWWLRSQASQPPVDQEIQAGDLSQVSSQVGAPSAVPVMLTTAKTSLKLGETTVVSVILSGGEKLSAADLELMVNPQVLEVIEVKAGGYWVNPQVFSQDIKAETGQVFFALGSFDKAAVNEQAALVEVTVKAKAGGNSEVKLGDFTQFSFADSKLPAVASGEPLVLVISSD